MTQLTLNQTTLLGATTGAIASLLLPLGGRQLLVPNASVVEVVEGELAPVEGKPEWFVGLLTWRDAQIPVLSFEAMNGQPLPRERRRVAIISGISNQSELPYYGLLVQAPPRPARVKIAELEDLENAPVGPVEFLQVRYSGELACIPDLDAVEARLLAG
jgi:chemosensory pili system protein ChpC